MSAFSEISSSETIVLGAFAAIDKPTQPDPQPKSRTLTGWSKLFSDEPNLVLFQLKCSVSGRGINTSEVTLKVSP